MSAKNNYFFSFGRILLKGLLAFFLGFLIFNYRDLNAPKLLALAGVSTLDVFLILCTKPASPVDSWERTISPRVQKEHQLVYILYQTFGLVFSVVCLVVLFRSLETNSDFSAIIMMLGLICSLVSVVKATPKLYNDLAVKSKIVPIPSFITIEKLIYLTSVFITPYGQVKVGSYKNHPMGYFLLPNTKSIVFFYIKNDKIIIRSEQYAKTEPKKDSIPHYQKDETIKFTQQLSDIFCYMFNTGFTPNQAALNQIFEVE